MSTLFKERLKLETTNETTEEQKDYRTESREGNRPKIKRSGGDSAPAEACTEVAPDERSNDPKYDRDDTA